jgi:hypothetical protein
MEEHYYRAAHTKLLDLGLLPFLLDDYLLFDLFALARSQVHRIEGKRAKLRGASV